MDSCTSGYLACILSDAVSSWGHLAVSRKMEKLKLSHLSSLCPSLPFLYRFSFSLAFPRLVFRLRLVFSTILRGSSGSFLLYLSLFHPRQILSLALRFFPLFKGTSVLQSFLFLSPNFPFRFPRVLYICYRWNTSSFIGTQMNFICLLLMVLLKSYNLLF